MAKEKGKNEDDNRVVIFRVDDPMIQERNGMSNGIVDV